MLTPELNRMIREYRTTSGRQEIIVERVLNQASIFDIDEFVDGVLGTRLTEYLAGLGDGLDMTTIVGRCYGAGFPINRADRPAIALAYRSTHE